MPVSSPISPACGLLPRGQWCVDPSRSRVEFTVRKLGAGTVRGRFADADGDLVVDQRFSASGRVRVASITTANEDRDAHLRWPRFFAAEAHPEIAFECREIVPIDPRSLRIRGDLTIRDQLREVELIATLPAGPDVEPRIEVRGEIDRRDFGLVWNRAIEGPAPFRRPSGSSWTCSSLGRTAGHAEPLRTARPTLARVQRMTLSRIGVRGSSDRGALVHAPGLRARERLTSPTCGSSTPLA